MGVRVEGGFGLRLEGGRGSGLGGGGGGGGEFGLRRFRMPALKGRALMYMFSRAATSQPGKKTPEGFRCLGCLGCSGCVGFTA